MYKVATGKYTFFLNGRSVYVLTNGQKLYLTNWDNTELKPQQYANLCHRIYTRKITTSDKFYELMGEYKMVSTNRSLK